ncbi:hypothetical protein POSPLADRAFT_1061887 [Postia placenta MAD-698-R-SB12]|uniref:Uncharacterized protein n=1 Tax=Postia placenta MAD-698-R-SB12 TaxID=670580 RepID=A0A1X6ML85_9APHY|nr:hypothetical protein POSPLADRAFT_1061887 [Postia placenta MAD-698-R-SB12]OSX57187.1 hypothetical protein POSPLADRAFT_1061887 [Postia placenta MAD-698-R-SB12]
MQQSLTTPAFKSLARSPDLSPFPRLPPGHLTHAPRPLSRIGCRVAKLLLTRTHDGSPPRPRPRTWARSFCLTRTDALADVRTRHVYPPQAPTSPVTLIAPVATPASHAASPRNRCCARACASSHLRHSRACHRDPRDPACPDRHLGSSRMCTTRRAPHDTPCPSRRARAGLPSSRDAPHELPARAAAARVPLLDSGGGEHLDTGGADGARPSINTSQAGEPAHTARASATRARNQVALLPQCRVITAGQDVPQPGAEERHTAAVADTIESSRRLGAQQNTSSRALQHVYSSESTIAKPSASVCVPWVCARALPVPTPALCTTPPPPSSGLMRTPGPQPHEPRATVGGVADGARVRAQSPALGQDALPIPSRAPAAAAALLQMHIKV